MNDCVFNACWAHLARLGIKTGAGDYVAYRKLKKMLHEDVDGPCWGGVVPFIVGGLADRHGFELAVEYDVWTPGHYNGATDNLMQRYVAGFCWNGATEGITLALAIYLLLDRRHAVFAEEIPPGLVVAAIQLQKRKETEI